MTEQNEWPHTQAHKDKGDWNPLWEKFAELDPEFLEAYLAFRTVPRTRNERSGTVLSVAFVQQKKALSLLFEKP